MTDPKVTVFIGNIIAAGVGLNLTAASKMIINSMSFVPSDYQQLIDRIHRLTQTKDVYAYIQLFTDTISERVWDSIIKKQLIIDKVIKKETDK
jgi:SWI/SNF-related matrix-associated actin-dependent regulator 1 of chromatin subfamily A